MAATVGEVLARLSADDTLLVLSDHGSHDSRRGLHVHAGAPAWFPQAERQCQRSARHAQRDKQRDDAVVVKNVYVATDVFKGQRSADAPDMQLAFSENYRASQEASGVAYLRSCSRRTIKNWSGDHEASDVADAPGVVVSNRALASDAPHSVDIAPTAQAYFDKRITTLARLCSRARESVPDSFYPAVCAALPQARPRKPRQSTTMPAFFAGDPTKNRRKLRVVDSPTA